MKYEIRKGEPIPSTARWNAHPKYPFATMEVGDSFLVLKSELSRVRQAMYQWQYRHPGIKFLTRKLDAAQWGVWRLK